MKLEVLTSRDYGMPDGRIVAYAEGSTMITTPEHGRQLVEQNHAREKKETKRPSVDPVSAPTNEV